MSDSLNQKIMRKIVCVKVNIRKELTLQVKRSTSWTISTFNPTFTDKIVQAEPNLRNEKKKYFVSLIKDRYMFCH